MNSEKYFDLVFSEITEELSANSRIRNFTQNSEIIGAYAEASILRLVRKFLDPYRVSTGSIISPELLSKTTPLPQIDIIMWCPAPLPGLFEVGDLHLFLEEV